MDSCWAKWPLWYFSKWPLWGYDDGRWWYDRAPIQAPHRISLLPQHLGAQMQVLMSWVMDQLNPGGIWNKKNNCRIRVKGHITWIFLKKTNWFLGCWRKLALAMAAVKDIDDDIKIKNLSHAGKYLDSNYFILLCDVGYSYYIDRKV